MMPSVLTLTKYNDKMTVIHNQDPHSDEVLHIIQNVFKG